MKPIVFTLPRILPLTNVLLRTHWAKRRKDQKELAWEVKLAVGELPDAPMPRARVTVERRSTGTADLDGLFGSAKQLLDALCAPSKRHPLGLGIITDDNPTACDLVLRPVKVSKRKEQCTVVTVEAIA